jgi:peptide/nickel transport system permease protein
MNSFLRSKKALVGAMILFLFLAMATVGPMVVPLDLTFNPRLRFQPPSLTHPLGTDMAGVDVLAQIIHGSRDVFLVAVLTAAFTIVFAVAVGITAGYVGGLLDQGFMTLVDVFLTIPRFPLMVICAALFRIRDPVSFALILAVWMWPGLARAVRSQVLSLREREFVEAARLLKLGPRHIILREFLPNVMPYIVVNFIGLVQAAIAASVGVMFLGLVPFSRTNWGAMLNIARQTGAFFIPRAVVYAMSPILAIMLLQLGGYLLAHGLDEIFNPRLRAHE